MTYEKVIRKQVISPDGKVVAEATSRVVVSGDFPPGTLRDRQTKTSQHVSTSVTGNFSSSSFSSSSSSGSSSSSSSSSSVSGS